VREIVESFEASETEVPVLAKNSWLFRAQSLLHV